MFEKYEEFTEQQIKILEKYVTNTSSHIFALRNLPEVIKGALFSRYSRSSLGLRSLLLKEFILSEETAFFSIAGNSHENDQNAAEEQSIAIQKAQNFYDRILDGYGDDSIGELGGAHLAVENVSMLAALCLEDCRLGGSFLEKSTRYIYFDQKMNGEYLFYREPILLTSAFKELYLNTCNHLFQTYSALVPELTAIMEKKFPKEHEVSHAAYTSALRAKVLDCLRGLLPVSAMTNFGVFGNGRFFETMIQKLNGHNLAEMQEIGRKSYQELAKVIPSFIRRSEAHHRHQKSFAHFQDQMHGELKMIADEHTNRLTSTSGIGVRLIRFDGDCVARVAAALLYPASQASLADLQSHCKTLSDDEIARILDAACHFRENRRHKSPRALEHAHFTFEITADIGLYRDLHRHRVLTQERQRFTCDFGYYVPQEIMDTEMEKIYCDALDVAKSAYDKIARELPEEAQYVVPLAYHARWHIHANLRALQWLCELRSAPAGHPSYRFIAQELARSVSEQIPEFERFFKFVDYDGHELGRLGQEMRIYEKKSAQKVS